VKKQVVNRRVSYTIELPPEVVVAEDDVMYCETMTSGVGEGEEEEEEEEESTQDFNDSQLQ